MWSSPLLYFPPNQLGISHPNWKAKFLLHWTFFSLLWVFQECDNCHMFSYKTSLFVERFHFTMLTFALVGWLVFMPRVKLSSLDLLTSLESHMSYRNVCVQCSVSIQEWFISPRLRHMMPTTMLLKQNFKFQSLLISVWNGEWMSKGLGLLQKSSKNLLEQYFDANNCNICCQCHPTSYGIQIANSHQLCWSSIIVHRFVKFFQWGWNVHNLLCPLESFAIKQCKTSHWLHANYYS